MKTPPKDVMALAMSCLCISFPLVSFPSSDLYSETGCWSLHLGLGESIWSSLVASLSLWVLRMNVSPGPECFSPLEQMRFYYSQCSA